VSVLPNVPEGVTCRTAVSPKGFYFESVLSWEINLYDENTERYVRSFPRPEEPGSWFTVSTDGHWLAVTSPGKRGDNLMIMERFH
jgi:hypothetical protein